MAPHDETDDADLRIPRAELERIAVYAGPWFIEPPVVDGMSVNVARWFLHTELKALEGEAGVDVRRDTERAIQVLIEAGRGAE